MTTDKPLLLSAILGCKNAIAIMTLFFTEGFLAIEVEGDLNGKQRARSQYSVRLYVADKKVLKSNPCSLSRKMEWNADNEM